MRHKLLFLFSGLFALIFATPGAALGAIEPYRAEVSPGKVILNAGENKLITLKFKNVGSKIWIGGQKATAVYLYGDSSVFKHPTWIKDDLPAAIKEGQVKPRAMATASFYVRAPIKTGAYTERFLLSYGPGNWIKGSAVIVNFTVVKPPRPIGQISGEDGVPPTAGQSAVAVAQANTTGTVPKSNEYKAELADKGGIEWQFMPGDHATVEVKFKNIGVATWKREGANYISFYTWSPKYRKSPFKDFSWKSDRQGGELVELEVKPGKIGTVRLEFRTPEIPGEYTEVFQLAAEDKAWIEGGSVSFPIVVTPTPSTIAKGIDPVVQLPAADPGSYSGMLMLTSHKSAELTGNGRLQLTQGFKNSGTSAWESRGLRLKEVSPSLGAYSSVRDESWVSSAEPVKMNEKTPPGQIGFVSYTIKAPVKKGDYKIRFQLVADGQEVPGAEVEIPITVTADGAFEEIPVKELNPNGTEPLPLTGDPSTLLEEPIIRVGLFKTTDDTMRVRGVTVGMTASLNGAIVCAFKAGEVAVVQFSRTTLKYSLVGPNCDQASTGGFVLSAEDGASPLEITDYSRPIAWLPGSNDNKFRAKLELRHTPATKNVWVINELPLETYLKGIAETSNVSPLEYQKALLTAARTYALYHVNRGTKHANEFYHVDAHLDQVYRGYGQEARSPNIVDGVVKTRGQIVTYEGKLAITPYFSRSDGRTRDWTEVWGGSGFAWLKAVPVPHDQGQTLWGHGVGLSARGALYMASKDNAAYDAILKHFYIGTELRKAYM